MYVYIYIYIYTHTYIPVPERSFSNKHTVHTTSRSADERQLSPNIVWSVTHMHNYIHAHIHTWSPGKQNVSAHRFVVLWLDMFAVIMLFSFSQQHFEVYLSERGFSRYGV